MNSTAPNVKSLFGCAPVGVPLVCDAVVETLERLLSDARAGKLHGIAYATVEAEGAVGTGWCGDAEMFRTEAAVSRLFFRVMHHAAHND